MNNTLKIFTSKRNTPNSYFLYFISENFMKRHNWDCLQDKCPYPCTCPTDGYCKGCEECPRQLGEPCNVEQVCDRQQGLLCRFKHGDSEGICRGKKLYCIYLVTCVYKHM